MGQTDIDDIRRRAQARGYIGRHREGRFLVNLAGDYDYLESAYYLSQDHENASETIYPTNKEMLDAYVTPIFLVKARRAGLNVPEHYISNGYFEPPVVIDPINPFMIRSRVVTKPSSRQESIAKSMTRNFTYAICCQDMPAGAKVTFFRAVLGWSSAKEYRDLAEAVWQHFHVPLARVRVMLLPDGRRLLSDISQLPFDKLTRSELKRVEEQIEWDK